VIGGIATPNFDLLASRPPSAEFYMLGSMAWRYRLRRARGADDATRFALEGDGSLPDATGLACGPSRCCSRKTHHDCMDNGVTRSPARNRLPPSTVGGCSSPVLNRLRNHQQRGKPTKRFERMGDKSMSRRATFDCGAHDDKPGWRKPAGIGADQRGFHAGLGGAAGIMMCPGIWLPHGIGTAREDIGSMHCDIPS